VIDASEPTVIPGLWDAHIHQQLAQSHYGSRQGRQHLKQPLVFNNGALTKQGKSFFME